MASGDNYDEEERRREWAAWAESGYRKAYQPRSVLRFGAIFTVLFVALLLAVIFWATRGLR
jgi:hypothetical protein